MNTKFSWIPIFRRAFAIFGTIAFLAVLIFGLVQLAIRSIPRPDQADTTLQTSLIDDISSQSNATTSPQGDKTATPSGSKAATPSPKIEPQRTLKPDAGQTTVYPGVGKFGAGGKADLVIKIIRVGYIDDTTGAFIATSSVSQLKQAAVMFEVTNVGRVPSGGWSFTAHLPSPTSTFQSEKQISLRPGDGIQFTIGFRNLSAPGENSATFLIVHGGSIPDGDLTNDNATAVIRRSD